MLNQTSRVTMFTTHFTDLCNLCYNFASENSRYSIIQRLQNFYSELFTYLSGTLFESTRK